MNKIMLLGRLVRDPEVRYTTTGKVVCQFTLAVDRPFTNQDGQREADFINIVVWGKTAELCGNSLMKGHRVLVDGRRSAAMTARTATNIMLPKLSLTAWNLSNVRAIRRVTAVTQAAAEAIWNPSARRFLSMRKSHFNKEGLSE